MRIVSLYLILIMSLLALNLPEYFSADFIQKIYSEGKILTYKGKIYTDSKNVFWKYIYPNEKYIWVKNKVYVYEPDLEQVTISKKPKFNLFDAVKNAKKIKNSEYAAKIDNKEVNFIYDKTLQKAWYTDDVGNKVVIEFKNQSTKKIKDKLFAPMYPKDADVIYQN